MDAFHKDNMKEKIVDVVFETLSSYPDVDWQELYLALLERAYKEGNKELATQAFYKMVMEAIRTNNTWAIKELTTGEDYIQATKELNLYLFGLDAIKIIPPKKSKFTADKYYDQELNFKQSSFKYQFRDGSQYLCACCHDFVLTCNEIQNFPLKNEEIYIREKFKLALSQSKLHKRHFIIDRLLNEYADKNPDYSLLFELWIMAEKSGIRVDPLRFADIAEEIIINKKRFNSFLTIARFRHHKHDSIIDDVSDLLLTRKKYDLAYFLNAKLSSPYVRLFMAVGSVLKIEDDEVNMIIFLKKVVQSVRHEKVVND